MAEDCTRAVGSGCSRFVGDPSGVDCDSGEPAPEGSSEDSGVAQGSGVCGPAIAGGPLWLIVLVALARRARWLAVLLLIRVAHAGVDADHVATMDGGDFATLREAEAGAPWTPSLALSAGWTKGNVVIVDEGGADVLLARVFVTQLGGSVRVGEFVRLGVSVPRYREVVFDGATYADQPGDIAVWLQVPMLEGAAPVHVAWWTEWAVPTAGPDLWLADPEGSVRGTFAAGWTRAPWTAAGNLGVKLTKPELIPGHRWGNRLEWGVGAERAILGPVATTLELLGSVPLSGGWTDGAAPIEGLATVDVELGRWWRLRAGGGAGLTHGVGSPSARGLVMVDVRQHSYADRDGDGIADLRDRCVSIPEDLDRIEDVDGCPEDDADGDQVPDLADPCPLHPETRNGWQDADGCPDARTTVVVTATSADPELPLESATLVVGEEPPLGVLAGEPIELLVPTGPVPISVVSPGFHPWSRTVDLEEGDRAEVRAELLPIRYGELALRLVAPDARPLVGFLRRGEVLVPVPAEGLVVETVAGLTRLDVSAVGHTASSAHAEVPAGGRVEVVVPLAPSTLRVVGSRIETGREIPFALDSAELTDDAVVDEIAALLTADPRIRLLRVEGHADEQGTSAYNLDLSRRRAQAVRDRLIARGIDPARLEAIGTGEARPSADGASRRVEFLVLVWADETVTP